MSSSVSSTALGVQLDVHVDALPAGVFGVGLHPDRSASLLLLDKPLFSGNDFSEDMCLLGIDPELRYDFSDDTCIVFSWSETRSSLSGDGGSLLGKSLSDEA